MRGDGRVFRPKRGGKLLDVWYYRIRLGKRLKEGRGFKTKAEAIEALKEERKRKARGEFVPPEQDRLTVAGVLDSYLSALKDRGAKSVASVACRLDRLKEEFPEVRAKDFTSDHVEDYRRRRLAAGLNRATIDREVEVLRAAFRLAARHERLSRVPFFPMYGVDNVRQGFFEREQTDKILSKLPELYAEIVRFVSLSGWRISEVVALRWEQVDRNLGELHLPDSKNGRPRTLALQGELSALIERRWTAREYRTRRGPASLSPFVFHQRRGRPVAYSTYRREFVSACEAAEVEGRTTHDFRRTVARDLRRAGVPETVAMSITGHVTAEIFRRYSIVDTRDQLAALRAKDALVAAEKSNVTAMPKR